MGIMSSEWRGRLQHWMRTLKDDFYRPLGEISWEAFRTMEHLSQEEAMNGPFEPVEPGFTWGKTWEYCWFRGKVVLPAEAQGKRIVMDLKPDGESTLFVNGQEFGTYRASWVTQKHHFVEDNVLTTDAVAGTEYEILMETYARHYYPESPDGGCATGPVLPGAYQDPLEEGKRRTLGICTFGIWNEDAYQLWMDADTLRQLLDKLDPNSLRAAKIAEALEAFTLVVDFEQDEAGRIASYKAASLYSLPDPGFFLFRQPSHRQDPRPHYRRHQLLKGRARQLRHDADPGFFHNLRRRRDHVSQKSGSRSGFPDQPAADDLLHVVYPGVLA